MEKSYKFIVQGKVQGVFYRKTIQRVAAKSGFSGYVKNLKDKTVETCVTCTKEDLEKFLEVLKKGSSKSDVENIQKFDCDEVFTNGFEIRY